MNKFLITCNNAKIRNGRGRGGGGPFPFDASFLIERTTTACIYMMETQLQDHKLRIFLVLNFKL